MAAIGADNVYAVILIVIVNIVDTVDVIYAIADSERGDVDAVPTSRERTVVVRKTRDALNDAVDVVRVVNPSGFFLKFIAIIVVSRLFRGFKSHGGLMFQRGGSAVVVVIVVVLDE